MTNITSNIFGIFPKYISSETRYINYLVWWSIQTYKHMATALLKSYPQGVSWKNVESHVMDNRIWKFANAFFWTLSWILTNGILFHLITFLGLTHSLHPKLEISTVNIMSVRKWGNEQTDRHTRNLKLSWTSAETSRECLPKIWKR